MLRLRPFALLLAAFLFDCATLSPIEAGTCGNGVVDDQEDCDSFAVGGDATRTLACGAPSAGASACRYVCTTAAECPVGWGCSVAGVCRAPSGDFAKPSDALSTGVVSMVTGDFDGDGRKDVLASGARGADNSARARIHFFGDGAALANVVALPAPMASPAVRDFDLDGLDDFAFGASGLGGFGVMTGQADRTFVPVMFPGFSLPGLDAKVVLVEAKEGELLPSRASASFAFAGTLAGSKLPSPGLYVLDSAGNQFARSIPVGVGGINGAPQWARLLDADPTSTCGEVVLPMKVNGVGVIHVYSLCKPATVLKTNAWSDTRPPIVIEGVDPSSPVHLADVDDDTHVDIVYLPAGAKKDGGVMVAHGDGTGFPLARMTQGEIPAFEVPLASGDLNGDGRLDYVTPKTIVVSYGADAGGGGGDAGAGSLAALPAPRGTRWTAARIANLNGDAIPDLVAASADQPDIDFFSGVQGLELTQSTIATSGPVSMLTVGDFDGDRLSDIAFVEGRAGSDTTDVAISYGRPFGPPEPARTAGRIGDISQIEVLPDATPHSLGIFLRTGGKQPGDTPTTSVALLVGSGDRQPLAPLLFSDGASKRALNELSKLQRFWSPVAVVAGPFARTDRVDLLGVAVGYTYNELREPKPPFPAGVWIAPGTGPAAFGTAVEVASFPDQVEAVDPDTQGFLLPTASGDLDGDGLLDVVTLTRTASGATALHVARLRQDAPQVTPVEIGTGVRLGTSSTLGLVDLDGDGALDVGAILLTPASAEAPSAPRLLFFANDGKGTISPTPIPVDIPPRQAPGGRADAGPVGFAMITTGRAGEDGRARRELAVVTQRRVLLFSYGKRDGVAAFTLSRELPSPLQGATGVVAGDLDGDGVEDLAIADGGALRVLRQLSSQEKQEAGR